MQSIQFANASGAFATTRADMSVRTDAEPGEAQGYGLMRLYEGVTARLRGTGRFNPFQVDPDVRLCQHGLAKAVIGTVVGITNTAFLWADYLTSKFADDKESDRELRSLIWPSIATAVGVVDMGLKFRYLATAAHPNVLTLTDYSVLSEMAKLCSATDDIHIRGFGKLQRTAMTVTEALIRGQAVSDAMSTKERSEAACEFDRHYMIASTVTMAMGVVRDSGYDNLRYLGGRAWDLLEAIDGRPFRLPDSSPSTASDVDASIDTMAPGSGGLAVTREQSRHGVELAEVVAMDDGPSLDRLRYPTSRLLDEAGQSANFRSSSLTTTRF